MYTGSSRFSDFLCHSLSLPVAVFVSLIPFHCFTALSFPLREIKSLYALLDCIPLKRKEKMIEKIESGDRLPGMYHDIFLTIQHGSLNIV